MAQFAPVAPVQILQALQREGEFGNYHLMLAHHTVERADEFRELMASVMSDRTLTYRNMTIIMDNSIVELGGAVCDEMIREATNIIKSPKGSSPNTRFEVIPVLPDSMGRAGETILLSREAYHRWARTSASMAPSFMLVTQGESWTDFTELVDYFFVHGKDKFHRIGWAGIPRKLLDSLGTRTEAVQYIKTVAPHVKIHLLGFSDYIWDDLKSVQMGAYGIDSAVPCRFDGLLSPMTPASHIGKRSPDWMEKGTLHAVHKYNIRHCRQWVSER